MRSARTLERPPARNGADDAPEVYDGRGAFDARCASFRRHRLGHLHAPPGHRGFHRADEGMLDGIRIPDSKNSNGYRTGLFANDLRNRSQGGAFIFCPLTDRQQLRDGFRVIGQVHGCRLVSHRDGCSHRLKRARVCQPPQHAVDPILEKTRKRGLSERSGRASDGSGATLKAGIEQAFDQREAKPKRLKRNTCHACRCDAGARMEVDRVRVSEPGLHHRLGGPHHRFDIRVAAS